MRQTEIIPDGEQEPLSPWQEFTKAMAVFKDDLTIVGHPQDSLVSPFDEPRPYGEYNLTQLTEDMTEEDFRTRMQGVTRIVVSCMDKRVARPVWEQLGGVKGDILFLSMAGGVVQSSLRRPALRTMAKYLAQFKQIKEVVVTGHDHICGAVKYFLGGGPLHEQSFIAEERVAGGNFEREAMEQLINGGACIWSDLFPGKIKPKLVEVDETNKTVILHDITIKGGSGKVVENFMHPHY